MKGGVLAAGIVRNRVRERTPAFDKFTNHEARNKGSWVMLADAKGPRLTFSCVSGDPARCEQFE